MSTPEFERLLSIFSEAGIDDASREAARIAITDYVSKIEEERDAEQAAFAELVEDFNQISERCARLREATLTEEEWEGLRWCFEGEAGRKYFNAQAFIDLRAKLYRLGHPSTKPGEPE